MHSVNKLIVGACPQSVLASVSASLASSGTLRYYIIPIMCTAVHNVHGRTLCSRSKCRHFDQMYSRAERARIANRY